MSALHLSIEGAVAELRLDNPGKLNALTVPMLEALDGHCAALEREAAVRAVIVTGEGDRAFCTGADITAWGPMAPFDFARHWVREGHRIFDRLARQQSPKYLWIGCSDSRVPANEIVGLLPGELFVHRNVANVVVHTDLNCLSVLQFAVDVLQVEHVIVCGHYQCGGVKAAMGDVSFGLIDHWLANIRDQVRRHESDLELVKDEQARFNRVVELNVLAAATRILLYVLGGVLACAIVLYVLGTGGGAGLAALLTLGLVAQ